MDKKIGLIFFLILFFTPLVLALDGDIFDANQTESREELSSKLESAYPKIPTDVASDLADAVYLIRQLEREIALTHELLGIREEKKLEEVKKAPPEVEAEEVPEPEELIVARRVSTKPGEIPPRESGSRISLPPPKKDIIPKLEREHLPPPTETYRYSQSELEEKNYSIIMEKEQLAIVPAPGVKRFLATNPDIISVSKEADEVLIRAINLGKGFLHIWDRDGRKSLKIKVIQKGYKTFVERRREALKKVEEMESFKVRYSYDRYRFNSNSETASRSYHYTEWFHRLKLRGETPWGMSNSDIEYQGKGYGEADFDRDLSRWSTHLTGPDIEFSVGNVGAYFSDITLPQVGYQGFRFKNPEDKKVRYDIMWGGRGSMMWGKKVSDWKGENYFYGSRFEVEPAKFISFNATAMRSQGNDLETSERIFAGGMGLNFFDGDIRLAGEYARGDNGDALKIGSNLKSREYNFDFKSVYQDIGNEYELVYDQGVPDRGRIGYYLKLNYYPVKWLYVTGEYNKFRDRVNPAGDHGKHNYDKIATLKLNLTDNTEYTASIWDIDRLGTSTRTLAEGQSHHLQQTFDIFGRNTNVYALYQPSKYKSRDSAGGSYQEDKVTLGMRMNVLKNLYFDISHLWHNKEMLETRDVDEGTARTINTGLSYSSQIFDTPFYGSFALRYRRDIDVISAISVSSEEKYWQTEAELKYRPSAEMELYLRVNNKDVSGVVDKTRDRDEMRIYGGGSYLFDTTLKFSKGGGVEGYVFKDINGNGVKEDDEEAVVNVDIYATEKKYTRTDKDGYYRFDKLKGAKASILLDVKTLPEGFLPTVANPQTIGLEKERIALASFGILARTAISGRVFNDITMDGKRDDEDYGVRDIRLTLDDGSVAYTDMHGYYRFDYVKEGERTLKIDPASLPPDMLPLRVSKKTVVAEEGKSYEEEFALYALRTVIGTVFVDENGNGIFEAGEEGVADVEVKTVDNITLTDDMGRFFLKKLKGGMHKIEVDITTIPEGYEIVGDAFKEIILVPIGEIKEDVDFPLKKE